MSAFNVEAFVREYEKEILQRLSGEDLPAAPDSQQTLPPLLNTHTQNDDSEAKSKTFRRQQNDDEK